jgi:hypothetical protein
MRGNQPSVSPTFAEWIASWERDFASGSLRSRQQGQVCSWLPAGWERIT